VALVVVVEVEVEGEVDRVVSNKVEGKWVDMVGKHKASEELEQSMQLALTWDRSLIPRTLAVALLEAERVAGKVEVEVVEEVWVVVGLALVGVEEGVA